MAEKIKNFFNKFAGSKKAKSIIADIDSGMSKIAENMISAFAN